MSDDDSHGGGGSGGGEQEKSDDNVKIQKEALEYEEGAKDLDSDAQKAKEERRERKAAARLKKQQKLEAYEAKRAEHDRKKEELSKIAEEKVRKHDEYIAAVQRYLKTRQRFGMLLSAYTGKQCAASQVRFFLQEFKETLTSNDYQIHINTDKQAYKDRSLIITKIKIKNKKTPLISFGGSKRRIEKERAKKLFDLVTSFEDMYDAVNSALNCWWTYKASTKHPVIYTVDQDDENSEEIVVRDERRHILKEMYEVDERTLQEREARVERIKEERRLKKEEKRTKKLAERKREKEEAGVIKVIEHAESFSSFSDSD